MMAPSTEAALGTGSFVRPLVSRDRIQVIGRDVLTPLPHVARHVIDAELIGCLGRDLMGTRGFSEKANAAENTPAEAGPEQPRGALAPRLLRGFVYAPGSFLG